MPRARLSYSFKYQLFQRFTHDPVATRADHGHTRLTGAGRAALPKLRESKEELDKQETKLSNLIAESADEARVLRQVDRVEAIRASLNKMRTLMLLHERQVLTPEQLVKFKAAYAQWEKDHPRPPR